MINKLRNFIHEIFHQGYKVVVMESSADQAILKKSKVGSAMNKFYRNTIHENPKQLAKGPVDMMERVFSREKTLMFTSSLVTLARHHQLKKLHIDEQSYFQSAWGLQVEVNVVMIQHSIFYIFKLNHIDFLYDFCSNDEP